MFVCWQMKHKKLPFWFRNLQKFTVLVQEETGPRAKNSPTLGVLFQPESLIQRFFHFWTNYNDTIYGLPGTVMNQSFQQHIKRRTHRMHFWFFHGLASREQRRHRVSRVARTRKDARRLRTASRHGRHGWKSRFRVLSISRTPLT